MAGGVGQGSRTRGDDLTLVAVPACVGCHSVSSGIASRRSKTGGLGLVFLEINLHLRDSSLSTSRAPRLKPIKENLTEWLWVP